MGNVCVSIDVLLDAVCGKAAASIINRSDLTRLLGQRLAGWLGLCLFSNSVSSFWHNC